MNGSTNQPNHNPDQDQAASPKGSANRLIHESSPYLLQHAHNPVDWYPWGEEAFERAVKEDKPVLVSIGYAACHWCHVMEKESFEDPQVAAVMNERFINIKVDREERPDIDHIYMDAVQAITGSGGWPLNVFLTPSRKPFYGGTYFPPRRAFNRASWTEVLVSISEAYRQKKDEVEQQADNLTQHLQVSNSIGVINIRQDSLFIPKKMDEAYQNIMKTADREWGGFGRAPKFPQTFTIQFLLNYSYLNKNEEARKQALLSLEKMMEGGIYDHVGGGFARYSTDTEWLVPHFEKMLYDNALLVSTLSDAYRLTQKEAYKEVIEETLQFAERELMHPDGGFYSALDADSEGVEGKFYVWSLEEAKTALGEDAGLFCAYFDITERGNWEGTNILRIRVPKEEFASQNHLEPGELSALIKRGKEKLLNSRSNRIRPLLDDKILLGWNALMNVAYSKAYAATGNQHYQKMAERNMHFLLTAFEKGGEFYHSWKNSQAKHPAFLDDYSYLIAALIELAQITADYQYLDKARELVNRVIEDFGDDLSPLFFYTHRNQNDVLLRKKEIYDGATPSGNAVMAANLYRLSIFYDLPDWRDRAEEMVLAMGEVSIKYPTSFGVWLTLLYEMISGTQEIAIVGKDWRSYLSRVQALFLPYGLRMASGNPLEGYPLLADKQPNGDTLIYLCRNYACLRPVKTVEDLISLLSVK